MNDLDKQTEVVQEQGNYLIVRYYADTLYSNGDKENGIPYYGDIYLTKEDVLKDHPEADILEGFGFVDKQTGYQPDDTPDWFDSVAEVIEYIKENQ